MQDSLLDKVNFNAFCSFIKIIKKKKNRNGYILKNWIFFLLELANTNESNEKIKYLKLKINK